MRPAVTMVAVCAVLALWGWVGTGPARAAAFCRQPVARATWTQEPQGARIKVFPTRCGRRTAWLDPRGAFRAALRAGNRPTVHRRSLFRQFRCHAYFAPFKPSWNLETWRPAVSAQRMVQTLCNPNGRAAPARPRPPTLLGMILQVVRGP